MKKNQLTRRLLAAFSLIRKGHIVVDIGTDHAHLPIRLVAEGVSPKAYASDIGKGPLERAKENILKAGLEEKITTVLTDGAEYFDTLADEFVIAGMGGELISSIISKAPFLKSPDVHMVLQPMTKQNVLKRFLCQEGFFVDREILVKDAGKIYLVLSVFYDGKIREITEFESLCPSVLDAKKDGNEKLLIEYLSLVTHDIDNRIYGKREAGQNTEEERLLRKELQKVIKKLRSKTDENM
ncbi:MAG: SAM-dependent methyltransferase [Ruminococcaceae bacterium]|nr:SAM-dependent methyltransferase [Oscillospiraceae bacterium]